MIECPICSTEFKPRSKKRPGTFCSRTCKGISSRTRESKSCEICDKTFVRALGRPEQRTCSRQCGAKLRRNGTMKNCLQCGREFYAHKSHSHVQRCSVECGNAHQGRNKTEHTCMICKKTFRWSPSRVKNNNVKYCSISCRDADPERRKMLLRIQAEQQGLSPTSIEVIGYGLLDSMGIDYLRQHLVVEKFCVDAFVPSHATVIEFDGNYWHAHPIDFPNPDARQRRRIAIDNSKDAYLRKCGLRVIRFWASDLERNLEGVKAKIYHEFAALSEARVRHAIKG